MYLLVGVLGFIPGIMTDHMMLGLLHINLADNLLHLVVGGGAAYAGFVWKGAETLSTSTR